MIPAKNRDGLYSVLAVLAVVLAVLLIGVGVFALRTALSGPVGQADAYRQKNSARNWTSAQARFEDLYQEVVSSDRKVGVAAAAVKADPGDERLKTTLLGTSSYCLSVVADYNADARKYLAEDFRSADLPPQIDDDDPDTDCKE